MGDLKRIGLTGGVASGKSVVASLLQQHGVRVVNLDTVGKNIVENDPSLLPRIATIAGPGVVVKGALDRRALRQVLFDRPEVRTKIEALLHPLIWKVFEDECAKARKKGEKIIVCEAALLIEAGLVDQLDALVVVMAPKEIRLSRLNKRDGIDTALAHRMFDAQVTDDTRRKTATYLIQNDGTLESLRKEVDELREALQP